MALKKFKNLMVPKTKLLIYESLFRSHILYGIELWGKSKSQLFTKLITLQKKAIRTIENKIHTEPIMKKYKILKVRDEHTVAVKNLAWSLIRNTAPISIKKHDFF